MKSTSRRWTDEEWARAEQLLADGCAVKAVAIMLGRTVREVCSKKQWMQMSADQRERKALQKQQRRAEQKEGVTINRAEIKIFAPEDAVADRNARMMADRSLTAFVFGDPPPGWSALDRRMA